MRSNELVSESLLKACDLRTRHSRVDFTVEVTCWLSCHLSDCMWWKLVPPHGVWSNLRQLKQDRDMEEFIGISHCQSHLSPPLQTQSSVKEIPPQWREDGECPKMRKVDQCSDEMKTVEKNFLRWHVRGDGMRWEELRWGKMRWEELTWSEMRWSVQWEVWRAQCEVWGKSSLAVALHRGRAGHLGQQHCNSFAQSTHARTCLPQGACKFYRWERSYIYIYISLRQLPPRLVRVLLVHSYIHTFIHTSMHGWHACMHAHIHIHIHIYL